jgi:hypothetical protein
VPYRVSQLCPAASSSPSSTLWLAAEHRNRTSRRRSTCVPVVVGRQSRFKGHSADWLRRHQVLQLRRQSSIKSERSELAACLVLRRLSSWPASQRTPN